MPTLEELIVRQPNASLKSDSADTQRQLRAAYRQLEHLSIAAAAFSTQLDFHKLLADIADHAHRILPVDRVVMYSNLDGKLAIETCSPQKGDPPSISDDARWCVRYLKPKVYNALNSHGAFSFDHHSPAHDDRPKSPQPASDATAHPPVRNSICVPFVASQNRVLAVIEFQNKLTGGSFTESDSRAALCLARIATSALDRARLFFRIEEWRQSIETLLACRLPSSV